MVARIFSAIMFSSLIVLILNFLIATMIVFFTAKILNFPRNSLEKAFLVVLSGFAIGFIQDLFFQVTFFFSWIAALVVYWWVIKKIYNLDYIRALYLWLISLILPIGAAILIVPFLNRVLASIVF